MSASDTRAIGRPARKRLAIADARPTMQPPGPPAHGGDGKGNSKVLLGSVPAFKAGEDPPRGAVNRAPGADQ